MKALINLMTAVSTSSVSLTALAGPHNGHGHLNGPTVVSKGKATIYVFEIFKGDLISSNFTGK